MPRRPEVAIVRVSCDYQCGFCHERSIVAYPFEGRKGLVFGTRLTIKPVGC
jgi:hypothetical protein